MKKSIVALGALAPAAVLAQESGATIALPTEFTTAISELQSVGTTAASSLTPMVLAIGGAFAVIGLLFVAFRYFKRTAK